MIAQDTENNNPKIEKRCRIVWFRYLKAGGWSAGVLIANVGLACVWRQYDPGSVASLSGWLQIIGGAFLLWSILGKLGWNIQTWSGDSPAERCDKIIFHTLNILGMFLLTVGTSAKLFG